MNLIKYHIEKIVLQDFLLKYQIKNLKALPSLTSLSFSIKYGKAPKLSPGIFFKVLTFNNPYITQSRINILSLNLRKGDPVGAKLILRKKAIYNFLIYFVFEVLPSIKNFDGLKIHSTCLHFQIKNVFVIDSTNSLYVFLKGLSTISLVVKGKNLNKNFFLSCGFPIKQHIQIKE